MTAVELRLSPIEAAFLTRWLQLVPDDLLLPIREHRFHPRRRWRFDVAWPDAKVAVELDGGVWKPGGGRHGQDRDRAKLNAAAVAGWAVLRFSGAMLDGDPAGCVAQVVTVLRARHGSRFA